jgi:uncharacterized integral membrane protein (TIGR00698 family)
MSAETDIPAASSVSRLWPGVALSAAIAGIALLIGTAQSRAFGRVWLDPLVVAILGGALWRSLGEIRPAMAPGIAFSARTLLEIAVVLIGAGISATAVAAAGWPLVAGIAFVVAASLLLSYGIGRALGLSGRMALLIAAGNSICGNSAIAAIAPVIGADPRDVAASIAFTAVLGVVVVLTLPLLAVAWGMTPQSFGIFAGLTVYAVPQVLAATAPISSLAAQIGTFVKLIRVLMLGPLVMIVALVWRTPEAARRGTLPLILPWFIVGFLAMMALRSAGLIPESVLPLLSGAATTLTLVAMAALGLGVNIRDIAAAGPRVTAAVTLSIIALGALALGMIRLVGPG